MTATLGTYRFDIKIELETPFQQSGMVNLSSGFDDQPLFDQHGDLMVSGDQIEGFIKAVMTRAGAAKADIFNWFGAETNQINGGDGDAGPLDSQRARLKIGDLKVKQPRDPEPWAYNRIAIDGPTGSVQAGALQVIAQPAPPGTPFIFCGEARLFAASEVEAERFSQWATAALAMVPAIGAFKSSGFGRIASSSLIPTALPATNRLDTPGGGRAPTLARTVLLTFDEPFLIDPEMRSGNVYVSAKIIPGNVLKGAIADMLGRAGRATEFADLLSNLVVRHAFPAPRKPVAPLSLAFCEGEAIDWLAQPREGYHSPRFASDWNNPFRTAVGAVFHSDDSIGSYTRVRTAINDRNAPIDGKLFSQVMTTTVDPNQWQTAFVLPVASESNDDALAAKLALLIEWLEDVGIEAIGKTAASAHFDSTNLDFVPAPTGDTVRLTLQTPAWMIRYDDLFSANGERSNGPLKTIYTDFFRRIGGESCEVVDFMAAQKWVGGARAIGNRSQLADRYYPWLLTSPGSVFIVRGAASVADWERCGMPIADPERSWDNCPFVRENGFGEVRVGDRDLGLIREISRV